MRNNTLPKMKQKKITVSLLTNLPNCDDEILQLRNILQSCILLLSQKTQNRECLRYTLVQTELV